MTYQLKTISLTLTILLSTSITAPTLAAPQTTDQQETQSLDDQLDHERFIKGLADLGLNDLLEEYTNQPDSPNDPAFNHLIQLAHARSNVFNADQQTEHDRRQTIEAMLQSHRDLIHAFPNDQRQPIWQGDFAFDLLFVAVVDAGLDLEIEFGIPTDEQIDSYQTLIDEVDDLISQATIGIEDWILDIEESPNFSDDVQLQEQRRSLITIEKNQRLPFLRGTTAYLKTNSNRDRSHDQLSAIVPDLAPLEKSLAEPWRTEVALTLGLTFTRLGSHTEAATRFDRITNDESANPRQRFLAALGTVLLTQLTDGELIALERVDELETQEWIHNDAFRSLILSDARCRLRINAVQIGLMHDSDPRTATEWISESYEPYRLNETISLSPLQREGIVLDRLARVIPKEINEDQLAPMMIASFARQLIMNPETRDEGVQKLHNLLEREKTNDATCARAHHLLAAAHLENNDHENAVSQLLLMMRRDPHIPLAPDTAGQSVVLASQWYEQNPTQTDRIDLLDRVLTLVVEQYPNHPDHDRFAFMQGQFKFVQSQYESAIEAFSRVSQDSTFYPDSQYQLTLSKLKLAENTATGESPIRTYELYQQVIEEIDRVRSTLTNHPTILDKLDLIECEALLAVDEPESVLTLLQPGSDGTQRKISDEILVNHIDLRIRALESLSRYDAIPTELDRLTEQIKQPHRINEVLDRLFTSTHQRLHRIELEQDIDTPIPSAHAQLIPIAHRVQTRLESNSITNEKTHRHLWYLIADSHRLAGEYEKALTFYNRVESTDSQKSADALFGRAECLYHSGQLAEAMGPYRQLATGLNHDRNWMYWQSELRLLQILDRAKRRTDRIYPTIQRLRMSDPALGGTRCLQAFTNLENDYEP